MTPVTLSPPGISPPVAAFAAEQGALDYLPAVLEMTRRIFSTVSVSVLLEDDPEIANDRHVVFEVDVSNLDEDRLLAAQLRWSGELLEHCPATVAPVFRYGLVATA